MYKLELKSGKFFETNDLNSITATIWVELIDWERVDKTQFEGITIPQWVSDRLWKKMALKGQIKPEESLYTATDSD